MLIKLNDLKIRKTEQNATDILFKFEDEQVTLDSMSSLKIDLKIIINMSLVSIL